MVQNDFQAPVSQMEFLFGCAGNDRDRVCDLHRSVKNIHSVYADEARETKCGDNLSFPLGKKDNR